MQRPKRADPEPWRCYRCEAPFGRLHEAIAHEGGCDAPFKSRPIAVKIHNQTKRALTATGLWNPNTSTVEVTITEEK